MVLNPPDRELLDLAGSPATSIANRHEPNTSKTVDTQLESAQSQEGTATTDGPPPPSQINTDSDNAIVAVKPTFTCVLIQLPSCHGLRSARNLL
ncbi:hypothetical protein GCM10025789_11850 [Tessaracoccus lubricantis]|uniref:Uncharacterized protein n=1 Tax=Tessaracoccus lubricantis TaxID=545543 RepID=A0ABP9F8L0_9ACTN